MYESQTASAFACLIDQLGVSFDLEAEFAQQYIRDRANQRSGFVTDTTYAAIQETLAEGAATGPSSSPELRW